MRKAHLWTGPAVAALLAAVFLLGCGSDESAKPRQGRSESGESIESALDHDGEHDEHAGEHGSERVVLSPEAIAASGITVRTAGPMEVVISLDLPGEIVPNSDRLAHIVPRFPGIAKEVHKTLGDQVRKDEVLAIVESNESLSPYEVTSLISGTVIEKHITLGEFVRDDQDIYIVADLSNVWVNVTVYARDLPKVKRGQRASVRAVGAPAGASGVIDYIGPVLGEATRAATARVVLANTDRLWRPGTFVTAEIEIERTSVPVGVPDGAVQRFEGNEAVFVETGEGFEPRTVTLGRLDGERTEIVSGLAPGERYVAEGSFILKSELLKSEAGHEH